MSKRETINNAARLLHEAHLRYQRQMLKPDASASYVAALPCSEIRGVTRQVSTREASAEFKPEWFTHLRPNFWKAYFDTLIYMQR
jgi:hypothetical protein